MTPTRPPRMDGVLDDTLDHAPFGFLSFDDEGTLISVNATALELLGYRRDELVGAAVETFLIFRTRGGEPLGALVNAVRRERAGGPVSECAFMRVREREKFEHELLRAKQSAEQASAALQVQKDDLLHVNRLLREQAAELEAQQELLGEQALEMELQQEELEVANEELLERSLELERQREIAEEANRAKSSFLAVMSHELRTPLNAIGGYVQLLDMAIHGPVTEAQHQVYARIDRSQRHLLRLINDVLNLARIESGRVEYMIEEVSLAALVANVTPMVEPQMAAKGIEFATTVGEQDLATADQEKVQQIVLNLLGNAVKFTPEGGRVGIETHTRTDVPDRVFLRVTDTGPGIPAAMLGSIFEPFVQVDSSHTRRSEGSGLGLAISRDLARGMGGDLRVRSEEGQGSTFTLSLPRAGTPG